MHIVGSQIPNLGRQPASAPGQPPKAEDPVGDAIRDATSRVVEMKDRLVERVHGLAARANFSNMPGYTGPEDGLSHPNFKAQAWLKPANRFVMNTLFRVEVEGKEKVPKDGKTLFCPTHPTVGDPSLISATLGKGDYRFVANVILFKGRGGPIITAMGAFPVDRDNPSRATIAHGVDLVKEGIPFVIFPEGGISENPNQVNPLKRGAAYFAIHGEADRIQPIGIHFSKDPEQRPREVLRSLAISLAFVGGTLAACHLGPAGQMVTGIVTGAVTGAWATSKVAKCFVPQKRWFNPFPTKLAGLAGGLVGGIAGAVLGGCYSQGMASGTASQAARVAAAGFASHMLLEDHAHRDIARIKFGDAMEMAPYQGLSLSDSQKVDRVTEDLHQRLGELKAELSGVPYDPSAPRIRPGTGIPVLPQDPAPLYFQTMAEAPMPKSSCRPRSDHPKPLTFPGKQE